MGKFASFAIPSPLESVGRAYSLQNLSRQGQLQQLQLEDVQRERTEHEAIRQVFLKHQSQGPPSEQGLQQIATEIYSINPEKGMAFADHVRQQFKVPLTTVDTVEDGNAVMKIVPEVSGATYPKFTPPPRTTTLKTTKDGVPGEEIVEDKPGTFRASPPPPTEKLPTSDYERAVARREKDLGRPLTSDEEVTFHARWAESGRRGRRPERTERTDDPELPRGVEDFLYALSGEFPVAPLTPADEKAKITSTMLRQQAFRRAQAKFREVWPDLRQAHPRVSAIKADKALRELYRLSPGESTFSDFMETLTGSPQRALSDVSQTGPAPPSAGPAQTSQAPTVTVAELTQLAHRRGTTLAQERERARAAGYLVR